MHHIVCDGYNESELYSKKWCKSHVPLFLLLSYNRIAFTLRSHEGNCIRTSDILRASRNGPRQLNRKHPRYVWWRSVSTLWLTHFYRAAYLAKFVASAAHSPITMLRRYNTIHYFRGKSNCPALVNGAVD